MSLLRRKRIYPRGQRRRAIRADFAIASEDVMNRRKKKKKHIQPKTGGVKTKV
jgi:hypothetical protein